MADQHLSEEQSLQGAAAAPEEENIDESVEADGDIDPSRQSENLAEENLDENEFAEHGDDAAGDTHFDEDGGEEEREDNQNEEDHEVDKSALDGDTAEDGGEGANEDEMKDEAGKEEDDEEDDEEEGGAPLRAPMDPNVMPQVNVQILASRKWQVKVYPLKPADFMSGNIWRVFKDAKESLLYLISAGKYSRGKGEMYISSVNMTLRVVQGLMKRDNCFPEINIEIVKKNDEGAVEEKAYMRFDTKIVRMLFSQPSRGLTWGMHGRKRERLIGSVFVKNLPPSTSKDMLRVMFPFAQEINYNPEKFKEGTARLVMKSRTSVIPCLKAFAKVELGGQVLELHPLEKKRSNTRSDSKSESRHRSRSASVEDEGDEKEKTDEDRKDKETTEENKEEDTEEDKKDSTDKKAETPKGKPQSGEQKERRKSEGPGSRQNTGKKTPSKKDADTRSGRDRKDGDRSRRPYSRSDSRGGPSNRGRQGDGFRNRKFEGGRGGFGARGRSPRGGARGYGERSYSSGGSKTDAMNVEATKDMLVLQNQLSMAIKSQLAVLNQTKMAVEQAKIGASGLGLGVGGAGSSSMLGSSGMGQMSDTDRGYSPRGPGRDRSSGYGGQKRKAPQAGLRQSDRGGGKRPFKGRAAQNRQGGGGGRGGSRASDYEYALREEDYRREMYARADELRAADSAYGAMGSSYGAGGSGAYGDYYGYY